jgi:hypothetical protein
MLKGLPIEMRGDRVHFPGVNWGYGDSDPYLVGKTAHYMVVRRKGVTDWESRGSSSYNAAEWILLEIRVERGQLRVVSDEITETPGRQWRKARTQLLAEMEELERKHHGRK